VDRVVLDASAVLARIHNEKGWRRVGELLEALEAGEQIQVPISSVNWCEILTCLHREAVSSAAEMIGSLLAYVDEVPFGRAEAEVAARMAALDPSLSLGDRACLGLASMLNASAWTTDKVWAKKPLGVRIELLR
jgi:ribonuclease VapC